MQQKFFQRPALKLLSLYLCIFLDTHLMLGFCIQQESHYKQDNFLVHFIFQVCGTGTAVFDNQKVPDKNLQFRMELAYTSI